MSIGLMLDALSLALLTTSAVIATPVEPRANRNLWCRSGRRTPRRVAPITVVAVRNACPPPSA